MSNQNSRSAAEKIFRAAVDRVNPKEMITRALSIDGSQLRISPAGAAPVTIDIAQFDRILLLGAGKAGAPMAAGVEQILGDRITDGVVAVKYGHRGDGAPAGDGALGHRGDGAATGGRVRLVEAGHPVPDEGSIAAARELTQLASTADERTLCITVISGGGSALLTKPAQFGRHTLSLEDIQATTSLLLAAGTPIGEINCVRKHLSGISGGRFCGISAPATVVALILSDVVGDDLESIASGLTAPDPTTFEDAWNVCSRYGIDDQLPQAVRAFLQAGQVGDVPETPKPGDPVFDRVHPILLGTNQQALHAARSRAEDLGYSTAILTSRLTGEAREIAKFFAALAAQTATADSFLRRPACFLAGGETTVTVRGSGKGGRNQEMALAFLMEMLARPASYRGVTFLSAGTDGNDGPTDAAGAWADGDLVETVRASEYSGIPISDALAANDAYHFFEPLGGLLKTGPTNTNVCDIQILIVE